MEKGSWRTSLAIVGAIIGAGFASGREINTFFARYGTWAWLAVGCATLVITALLLCVRSMPRGALWRVLYGALTAVTGGAMTACSGEIAALLLPVHGAEWLGMALALAVGMGCSKRSEVLTGFGGALTAALLGMLTAGLFMPDEGVSLAARTDAWRAVCSGVCYAGMNAVLALPLVTDGRCLPRTRSAAIGLSGAMLGVLLALGTGVLLRHPSLHGETLPLIRLMGRMGGAGHWACGLTMELAVLTTLLACVKGLTAVLPKRLKRWWPVPVGAAALCGFGRIVGGAYPVLGALCLAVLVIRTAAERLWGQISSFARK